MASYLTYWLADVVEPNRAPLTYAAYETLGRLYISPRLGGTKLDRLAVRDAQTWLNLMAKTCQCLRPGQRCRSRCEPTALLRYTRLL